MRILLPLLLITSQLMYFPNLSFRWCKEFTAQLAIVLSLSCAIWKKNKSLALYLMWCLLLFLIGKSLIVNDAGGTATFKMNPIAFFNMINIVLYGILYYILHNIKIDRERIYNTFCFIAIFQSLYVILQHLQLDQFFYNISYSMRAVAETKRWPVGLWGNETLVSWCIAICSPYFLAFKRLRYKIGYCICYLAVFLTGASTALAVMPLGFLFWLYHKGKRLIAILLLCSILVGGGLGYFSGKLTEYFNPTHRIAVWEKSIEIAKERGITGWGLGSYREIFWRRAPEFRDDGHWSQTHNDWIQQFFETGIVGLGLLLSLIFIVFLRFVRTRRGLIPLMSILTICLIACNGFPFRTAMGALFIVSLVLFEKEQLWQ